MRNYRNAFKDEWNSGCDWLKLWQACGMLVRSGLDAVRQVSWYDNLGVQYPHGTQERDKAIQSSRGRTGGAFTILHRCKRCGLMLEDDFMWFLTRQREPSCILLCSNCAALGTCIVAMQHGDAEETCKVYQPEYSPQENCKSVVEALIMANNVHGGRCMLPSSVQSPQGVREGMERV